MSTKAGPFDFDISVFSGERISRGAAYSFLILMTISIVLPYLWVVGSSFKAPGALFQNPLQPLPSEPTLENWRAAWEQLGPFILNSVIMGIGTALLALIAAVPASYAFGRLDFPGKDILFYGTITALLFPFIVLVIPITSLWRDVGLFNTFPGVMLAHQIWVLPFSIWILRDFFEDMPVNIEEAAQVYGCTQFEAFYRVILPLSVPPIAAIGFLGFLHGWNEFLFTNLLTVSQGPVTATLQLYSALQAGSGDQIRYSLLMAMALIVAIPPSLVYLYVRRHLTQAFAVD